MRKSKLSDGTPFFGISVEHFVTKHTFARAIASYFFRKEEKFDPKTNRRAVIEIVKKNLFFQGIEGESTDHWDGASEEFVKPFNDAYEAAITWIEKNYPYLDHKPKELSNFK